MWPWEHAIVGYLAYSMVCHLYYRASPGGLEALAVVFASVLPDLIDKPLAWEYGVFETGYALGHSIFFAVPLAIVVGLFARSRGRTRTGIAFGVGYLLHLPADVLDTYLRGGRLDFDIVLWPLTASEGHYHDSGFLDRFVHYFSGYQQELLAGELTTYRWTQLGLATTALLLWLYDGAPVLRDGLLGLHRLVIGSRSEDGPS